MAGPEGPEETGKAGPDKAYPKAGGDDDLDRRRRQLEAALAARRPRERTGDEGARPGNAAGYAVALRLSSEFIVGILGGAAIGWVIDHFAGTTPWGLIVFLLLGFCAGILNVLRSAGVVAERSLPPKGGPKDGKDSSGGGE
jgi:ATP synthase protein I